MLRDKLKTEEYFKEFIQKDTNRINKFLDGIKSGFITEDRIPSILRTVYDFSLIVTVAKYSAGFNVKEIESELLKTIDHLKNGWDKVSGYVEILWTLSMAILLNISDNNFNKIVEIIDDKKLTDYIIDYIIAHRIKDRSISKNVIFEKPYKTIVNIIQMEKDEAERNLKRYLEKEWYKGHSDKYWYNNHNSKHNTYFGYWSFESAVIVKIKGLNNEKFKDTKYYPYDMVI
jgi:hypothetical protein